MADYEIVNIPTSTYNREGHQNFKLKIDVAFGEPEIVAGKSVLETVDGTAKFVEAMIGSFEPFLS